MPPASSRFLERMAALSRSGAGANAEQQQQQKDDDSQGDDESTDSFFEMLKEIEALSSPGAGANAEAESSRIDESRAHGPGAGGFECPRGGTLRTTMIAEAIERQTLPLRREIDDLRQQHARDVADLRAEIAVLADDVLHLRAQLRRHRLGGDAEGAEGAEE